MTPRATPGAPQQQRIDWYGTLRARFGWLPMENLLLFATGGLLMAEFPAPGLTVRRRLTDVAWARLADKNDA
jgi:outer membrane immunogenic protein